MADRQETGAGRGVASPRVDRDEVSVTTRPRGDRSSAVRAMARHAAEVGVSAELPADAVAAVKDEDG